MGGIYSKDFLMYSSFLFPANIWSVFIGSQFNSVIPHAAASLPASSSTHKSTEKFSVWKSVGNHPWLFGKLNETKLTRAETGKKESSFGQSGATALEKQQVKIIQFV